MNRLKTYFEDGLGVTQIQSRYFPDRTYASVFAQLRKLGLVGKSGGRPYNQEELGLIRHLVQEVGLTATQISARELIPSRSADSIQAQIGRMGLADDARSAAVRRARLWTSDEDEKLMMLVCIRHLTVKEICAGGHFPERTVAGIHDRISRLHLADAKRSESARQARSESLNGKLNKYREFLQENASTMNVDEIAEQWSRSPQLVRRDLRLLGIRVPTAKPSSASIERIRACTRTAQQRRWTEWRKRRREALLARREEIRTHCNEFVERTCQACGETWPLTREFFRHKYNLRRGVQQEFFSRSCVLCRS